MKRAKVLIADNYWFFRRMMRTLVEGVEDFQVTGEAASLTEAVYLARYYPPDLIVMGLPMLSSKGDLPGHLFPKVPLAWAGAKLVAVGDSDLPEYAELAARHGAAAYLNKEDLPSCLVSSLRALLNHSRPPGEEILPPTTI